MRIPPGCPAAAVEAALTVVVVVAAAAAAAVVVCVASDERKSVVSVCSLLRPWLPACLAVRSAPTLL